VQYITRSVGDEPQPDPHPAVTAAKAQTLLAPVSQVHTSAVYHRSTITPDILKTSTTRCNRAEPCRKGNLLPLALPCQGPIPWLDLLLSVEFQLNCAIEQIYTDPGNQVKASCAPSMQKLCSAGHGLCYMMLLLLLYEFGLI
jgi:hypothetical protein